MCVTIKKYSVNVNKPTYIQIRLFTAKQNEAMKQVVHLELGYLKKIRKKIQFNQN